MIDFLALSLLGSAFAPALLQALVRRLHSPTSDVEMRINYPSVGCSRSRAFLTGPHRECRCAHERPTRRPCAGAGGRSRCGHRLARLTPWSPVPLVQPSGTPSRVSALSASPQAQSSGAGIERRDGLEAEIAQPPAPPLQAGSMPKTFLRCSAAQNPNVICHQVCNVQVYRTNLASITRIDIYLYTTTFPIF
jgi:hypothetical protein